MTHNRTKTHIQTLSDRYADFACDFVTTWSAAAAPWFFYMAFNHVHVPNFVDSKHCNTTLRGLFGDALYD